MANPDVERLRNIVEALVDRTRNALERGLDEVQREARVGKVKLLDIYQLRRERGRLHQRLGEEVYALIRKGDLEVPAVSRTVAKIAALDEKIEAKEAEVERIRVDEEGAPASRSRSASSSASASAKKKTTKKKSSSSGSTGGKKKSKSKSKTRKKRTLGTPDDESES